MSPVSAESYNVGLQAAGGVLAAVDAVMAARVRNAFCRPPSRPPRQQRPGDGVLPLQQRGDRRSLRTAETQAAQSANRGLGRAPRQWDPGDLLRRSHRDVLLGAPASVLSAHGHRRGDRGGQGREPHDQRAPAGRVRRPRVPAGVPGEAAAGRDGFSPRFRVHLGGIRRPSGRSAGRHEADRPAVRRADPHRQTDRRAVLPGTAGLRAGRRLRPGGAGDLGPGHLSGGL